jgi:uncharacterized integral membrane protein
MNVLGSIILLSLALLAVFATVNWAALTAPTGLSFVVFTFEAPLGLILIGFALGFALLLLGYVAVQRTAMFVELRRHAQELKAQREIAEKVEASRIHELQLQLEREAGALRTCIEQTANGLAASIGELDDKLDRSLQRKPAGMGVTPPPASEKTGS